METEKIYLEIWESQAEAEAEQKQSQAEPSTEAEAQQEATTTEFFIYSDGIRHNRNIEIIDSKEKNSQNKQEFKVIGKLSKTEQRILRAIKK